MYFCQFSLIKSFYYFIDIGLDNVHPEVYKKRSNHDLQARRSTKTKNLDREGDNEKASKTSEHVVGDNNRRAFEGE